MKHDLPDNCGIPDELLQNRKIVFHDKDRISITDIQYEALEAGVCRGNSLLILAPTSTGKTQIALWGLAAWLRGGPGKRRVIYLVTHRSLANQKFDEFKYLVLDTLFEGSEEAIVLATGDKQENAAGEAVVNPLDSSFLIATYEKFLGILCSMGIPSDLSDFCIICDEIQIIGDKSRGVNIEILLTLLKQGNPGQFIGLSAVLSETDADKLAVWLNVQLLRVPNREKHLDYECYTPTKRLTFSTERSDSVVEQPRNEEQPEDVHALIRSCLKSGDRLPIVVFCMRKKDVYDGCRILARYRGVENINAQPLNGISTDTEEGAWLSALLPHRVAMHSADLLEMDRLMVEQKLKDKKIDVVFATSTLAAGVNFPIGTVIFYSWKRWDPERRNYEPIPAGEFHNMAGRCGRMGADHASGRVLFFADDGQREQVIVRKMLNPDHVETLQSYVSPKHFPKLLLQLSASNVVNTEDSALNFLKLTFGASREIEDNIAGVTHWQEPLSQSLDQLRSWSFLR